MTVLRRDPSSITNYFDELFRGIGHRGSSFMDLDNACFCVSHDGETKRALIMEFKDKDEPCSKGQQRVLEGLTELSDRITCWYLQRQSGGVVHFAEYRKGATQCMERITEPECRERYRQWWDGEWPHGGGDLSPLPRRTR